VAAAAAPAVGDRVRPRPSIYTDGHIDFGQTINSGAEAVTSDATVAGRAAFGSNRLAANVTDFGPPPGAALIRRVAADYAIRTGSSFAEAA
ncbi:MAG: hypothetical protein U9Q74_16835, partial [Gemmatimonadota bacterium]|nr:hypothetical protein [Gemmatimonadota bacterium]